MPGLAASLSRSARSGRWACQHSIASASVKLPSAGCCSSSESPGAGCDNPPVPAGQAVLGDKGSHAIAGKALINFPARVARLANLQLGAAKAPDVANPDIAFINVGRRNVFTEAADDEEWRAMDAPIGLLVANEAVTAKFERTGRRLLVHAGRATGFRERSYAADEEGNVCHGWRILPSIPQPCCAAYPRGIPMCRRPELGVENVRKNVSTAAFRQVLIKPLHFR